MIRYKKDKHYTSRFRIVLAILLLAALALTWRMIDLMVIKRSFLVNQGDARMLRTISSQAYRGMLTDRYGNPLAISTPVDSAWSDPQVTALVEPSKLAKLAKVLGMTPAQLTKRLQGKNRDFTYLKRHLTPTQSDQIKALNIPGVFLKNEYRRYYPEGEVAAQVLGLTNIDDKGQEGLELGLNKQLQGIPGLNRVIKDRMGHVVTQLDELREPKPGQNITLSIDRRIQYIAYRELQAGMQKYNGKAGSAVVLDIKTGEILAMVSLPSYNPNDRPNIHDGRFRNRAVTDIFEPGSTLKTFAVALGLESGHFTPDTIIDTAPGWMNVGNNVVRDEHYKGSISVTDVLKVSSNVGVTKIVQTLPPDELYNKLKSYGLGQNTGSGFPGESGGQLNDRRVWGPFAVATLSFGYGVTVTTLQLAQIYAMIANNGVEVPVTFLKRTTPPVGKQLMPAQTAKEVVTMLESVVEPGGTATRARVPGYWVAGKTGTTRIVTSAGYDKNRHNTVFAGIAPASAPRLVVVVFVNDPDGKRLEGGSVAAPIFSQIMSGALRILNIAPDHLPEKK